MGERDPFVMTAIRNVVARQSSNEWWAMLPTQRTQAIYAEIRRLDAETIRQCIEERRSPAEQSIFAGA
jgi:hypothetical protein